MEAGVTRRARFLELRRQVPVIMPSLLLCDFGDLASEVRRLEAGGVKALHLDVMDGVFVPNLTYGMTIVAAVRRLTQLPLDVHLMISAPERLLTPFYEAGADLLTVHVEAVRDVRGVLGQIRQLGAAAGLALNPQTPLERCDGCWDLCDVLLVMSVDAGFGGQAFQPVALEKLVAARRRMRPETLLQIDGGVNRETIHKCAAAGADLFVAGSAIFRGGPGPGGDYGPAVATLRELAIR